MKSRTLMYFAAITLFAALAIPVGLAAEDNQDRNHHKHHHYQLVDLGTFGGPSAYLCNDPSNGGGACGVLNSGGTVVGEADTTIPDPHPVVLFLPRLLCRSRISIAERAPDRFGRTSRR